MKIQTYVINLDRSADRWQRIHHNLSDLGVAHQRVDAIDAQAHSLDDSGYNATRNMAEYFLPLKNAEVACYMSHLKALKQFLADPSVEYGLVLEDDVELLETSEGMEAIANWLGCNNAGVVKLYSKRRVFGSQVGHLSNATILKPWRIPLGFQAQLWNRLAAQEFVNKSESFYQAIDVEFQFSWRYNFSVYVLGQNKIKELNRDKFNNKIVTTIEYNDNFWIAEEYHQKYLKKNPSQNHQNLQSLHHQLHHHFQKQHDRTDHS